MLSSKPDGVVPLVKSGGAEAGGNLSIKKVAAQAGCEAIRSSHGPVWPRAWNHGTARMVCSS